MNQVHSNQYFQRRNCHTKKISAGSLRAVTINCCILIFMAINLFVVTNVCFAVHLGTPRANYSQDLSFSIKGINNPVYNYIKSGYLWRVERFLYPNESAYKNQETISELLHDAAIAKISSIFAGDTLIHRYDDPEMLKISGGPQVNQELCLNQLDQLIERAVLLREQKGKSKDIELNRLLDYFGRAPAELTEGYISWLGSYNRCTKLKMNLNEDQSAMRYCSSAIRLTDWPEDSDIDDFAVITLGVCLPKSCDSLNYKNKFQLVRQLAEFNSRPIEFGTWNLTYLYCLPDEESDLRIWWKSPGTIIAGCLIISWLSLLILATIEHERLNKDMSSNEDVEQQTGLKNGIKNRSKFEENANQSAKKELYKSLSIYRNLKSLVDEYNGQSTSTASTTSTATTATTIAAQITPKAKPKIIDLRCIDGIKVLCMFYIIIGHYVMGNLIAIENWHENLSESYSYSTIAGIGPALVVDPFLLMTGMLTVYTTFKQPASVISLVATPSKWLHFVVKRYFRILPVLAAAVIYTKYFATFIGAGPSWDYATSRESQRRMCHRESWLWTLGLAAGYKDEIACVPAAWYLTSDFVFTIITPPILACLYKNATLGKLLILGSIVTSFVYSTIYFYDFPAIVDLRPLSRGLVHTFKAIFTYKGEMYIRPRFRISPYLIGLYLGYILHCYEKIRSIWLSERAKKQEQENCQQQQVDDQNLNNSGNNSNSPDWPKWFINYGPVACIIALIFTGITQSIVAPFIHMSEQAARISTSVALPVFHSLYATLIGFYIFLCSTGHGLRSLNNFLVHRIWKLLAKLSLCALCINMETSILVANQFTHLKHFDIFYLISHLLYILLITYALALALYVLVEMPMRAITNRLIARIFPK